MKYPERYGEWAAERSPRPCLSGSFSDLSGQVIKSMLRGTNTSEQLLGAAVTKKYFPEVAKNTS